MDRRTFVAGALTVGAAAMSSAARRLPARPNVILILTDDQGYGELGRHGNPILRTPHLDRLHDTSIHFDRFHVSPTCSPTRAALMTGRHEFRSGVSHTICGRSLLDPTSTTLPRLLADAGYATGLFGKWHLGDAYPCRPMDLGFGEALYHGGGGITQAPDWWGNSYFSPTLRRNGRPETSDGFCTNVFFDAALDWIGRHRAEPFFCYLPTNAPHSPLQVPDADLDRYRDAPVDDDAKRFYAMIQNIDDNVGRLLSRLDDLGLRDSTLVIFMGDNGSAEAGNTRRGLFNAGMRGAKGSVFEGGTRVPSLWHLPAFGPGRGVGELTSGLDLLPTLAELCGAAAPADLELDGRSLMPLLTSTDADWPDRMLVTHVGRWEPDESPADYRLRRCSVRSSRYRWVEGRELYDLADDPGETTDVLAANRRVAARMAEHYEAWWAEVLPALERPVRLVVGADAAPSTELCCMDWRESMLEPGPAGRRMPFWRQDVLARVVAGEGFESGGQTVTGGLGSWAVTIARDGRYRFRLRQLPAAAGELGRLRAGTAHLRCGDRQADATIATGALAAEVELDLAAGEAELEGWFDGQTADGRPRGSFYLDAERLR